MRELFHSDCLLANRTIDFCDHLRIRMLRDPLMSHRQKDSILSETMRYPVILRVS